MDENGSGLIVTLSLLLMDYYYLISVPGGSDGKESACNAGDPAFIPWSERPPGEGNGYPLQYSGLENSMDCIVHGIAKSQMRLSDSLFHILHFMRKHCPKVILYLISACIVKKKNSLYEFCTKCLTQNAPLKASFTPFQDKKTYKNLSRIYFMWVFLKEILSTFKECNIPYSLSNYNFKTLSCKRIIRKFNKFKFFF